MSPTGRELARGLWTGRSTWSLPVLHAGQAVSTALPGRRGSVHSGAQSLPAILPAGGQREEPQAFPHSPSRQLEYKPLISVHVHEH